MKNARFGLILGLLALCALPVLAGESSYLLTPATTLTAPASASQAGAITLSNGFRGVGVAVADFNDGGNDQDLISGSIRAYAWILPVSSVTPYAPLNINPDGGAGWLRYPRLDVAGIADAGGTAVAGSNGVQGQFFTIDPIVTSGFYGSKLYYTVGNATYDDAGVAVVKVTITTLY